MTEFPFYDLFCVSFGDRNSGVFCAMTHFRDKTHITSNSVFTNIIKRLDFCVSFSIVYFCADIRIVCCSSLCLLCILMDNPWEYLMAI